MPPNAALAQLLELAGWSPRRLARELNKLFGAGTVSETAPYHWRDHGGIPHTPVPALAAFVLSRHLQRRVTVAELWGGDVAEASGVTSAAAGLDRAWAQNSTQPMADEWLGDRRVLLAVSGLHLAQAVAGYLHGPIAPRRSSHPTVCGASPLVEQIEQSVPLLQRLDDAKGGGAHLEYIGAQVRAVSLVLREHRHDPATTRRLLMALTDLSQLAGWMAIDASKHGLAQRYLFHALRTAHAAEYDPMAGHILADLSGQSTTMDNPVDAVMLGEAAAKVVKLAPARVRASVHSRLAVAYAGANDVKKFEQARADAQAALASNQDGAPDWMYYLTTSHLDCQAGYAMVMLGRQLQRIGSTRAATGFLEQGQALLETVAYRRPPTDPSQRRALYEGAWLTLGYALQGKFDQACRVGRIAVARVESVKSPRSVAILRDAGEILRHHNRNRHVQEFLPALNIATATSTR